MFNIRTRVELAIAYNVSTKILRRWFEEADLHIPAGYISPANLALIFEKLGPPTHLPPQ
jgi:hypothetical protein